MFDQTPVQERHAAIGVFTAIGLSAMAAFHLLLTDGFAPLLPQDASAATPPEPAYVRVLESDWAPPETVRIAPTSYAPSETYAPDYGIEDLDGGANGRTPTASAERSYEDITRDIDALYQQTSDYRQQDYGDAVYDGAAPNADDFVYSNDVEHPKTDKPRSATTEARHLCEEGQLGLLYFETILAEQSREIFLQV